MMHLLVVPSEKKKAKTEKGKQGNKS